MLSGDGSGNLRPEPRVPLGREDRVKAAHGFQRVALILSSALHLFDGLDTLVMMGATVFFRHG
jgi:hypothetical protein